MKTLQAPFSHILLFEINPYQPDGVVIQSFKPASDLDNSTFYVECIVIGQTDDKLIRDSYSSKMYIHFTKETEKEMPRLIGTPIVFDNLKDRNLDNLYADIDPESKDGISILVHSKLNVKTIWTISGTITATGNDVSSLVKLAK